MSAWRTVIDEDTGQQYLVRDESLWEMAGTNEIGEGMIEMILRCVATGETISVEAKRVA